MEPETKNNLNPVILIIFVAFGILAVLYFTKQPIAKQTVPESTQSTQEVKTEVVQTTESTTSQLIPQVKRFKITASNFTYDLKEISVKKGDTVLIDFVNGEGFHDWRLDEFNAKTKVIKTNETDTIEFVADKVGTFEYYCSVGAHRAVGMKGKFVVE